MKLVNGIITVSLEEFMKVINKEVDPLIVAWQERFRGFLFGRNHHYLTIYQDFIFHTKSSKIIDFNSVEIITSTSPVGLSWGFHSIPLFFDWTIWIRPNSFLSIVSKNDTRLVFLKINRFTKKHIYFVTYKGFLLFMNSAQACNFPASIEIIHVQENKLPSFVIGYRI